LKQTDSVKAHTYECITYEQPSQQLNKPAYVNHQISVVKANGEKSDEKTKFSEQISTQSAVNYSVNQSPTLARDNLNQPTAEQNSRCEDIYEDTVANQKSSNERGAKQLTSKQ